MENEEPSQQQSEDYQQHHQMVVYQGTAETEKLAVTEYKGNNLSTLDEQALCLPSYNPRKPPNQPQPMKEFIHDYFTVEESIITNFAFDGYDSEMSRGADIFRVRPLTQTISTNRNLTFNQLNRLEIIGKIRNYYR